MRTGTDPEGVLIVEIDLELDVMVTFVFERKDGPLVYRTALCEYPLGEGRTARGMYGGFIRPAVLSLAKERALDACADHDREPTTERGT